MTASDKIQRITEQKRPVHKVKKPKLLKNFNNYLTLSLDTTQNEHHFRNLNNIKLLMQQQPDLEWKDLTIENVKQLLVHIEEREVTSKTKNKYRESLNKYLEMQDKKWDEMTPQGVTVYQKTTEKQTKPEKIPDPEEVKKFLQEIETRSHETCRLRNLAYFFTLWDTGARSGALVKAPLEVEINEKYVTVTVPPVKESPKRNVDCPFASILLKKYLENHPQPDGEYLFPQIFGSQDRENASQNNSEHMATDTARSLARKTWRTLTESDVVDVEWRQQPLHIFRKSMKTWFNNMDIQNETDIDVRAGHIIGSDYTRTYTRKSDEDSNRSLRKNLGIEEEDSKDWKKVLWPKKCSECSELNSGHRDLCNSCQNELTQTAYPEGIETEEKLDPENEFQDLAEDTSPELVEQALKAVKKIQEGED